MEQSITANQRDMQQAITLALLTGLVTFIMTFLIFITIETVVFSKLNLIEIEANSIQTFAVYLSHALHSELILKGFGVTQITLLDVNQVFKNSLVIYAEYFIFSLSFLITVLVATQEYLAQMINEKFISGVHYFTELKQAKKMLSDYQKEDIEKTGEGVKIAGVPISRDRETKHMALIGKTGSGKTVALIPIMREAINRGENEKILIFDNKGDFTSIINDANGEQPIIVAPWDARSASWNIARDCRTLSEASELAARFIAESSDPMWSSGARQILTGLIHKLQRDNQENWGWSDLAELLYIDMNEVEKVMEQYHPEGKRAVESLKKEGEESGEASKTTQSLLITLSAQLSPVYRMAEAWKDTKEQFSVRDFLDGKLKSNVVILQGNASLLGIQNAYIQGIIAMLSGRVNSPDYKERPASAKGLWLFLDEFPQLGKLPEIKPFLEIGRSKGVRVVMGFQNPSQLKELYDKDGSDSMLDIFQSYIFCMLGSEASTWASESIGQKVIERFKFSTSQNFGESGSGSASSNWERSEEPACKPLDFTQGLGVDSKAGGTWALYWPTGGDVYKLLFKFSDAPKVRESSIKASWVTPEWDSGFIDKSEINKKISNASSSISDFNAKKMHEVDSKEEIKVNISNDEAEAEINPDEPDFGFEVSEINNENIEESGDTEENIDNEDKIIDSGLNIGIKEIETEEEKEAREQDDKKEKEFSMDDMNELY